MLAIAEIQIRQHIGLAVVDQRGKFRPFRPQLVGDVAQHLAGLGPVGLQESLAQRRRYHALLSFGDIGKSIAHPMHTGTVEETTFMHGQARCVENFQLKIVSSYPIESWSETRYGRHCCSRRNRPSNAAASRLRLMA